MHANERLYERINCWMKTATHGYVTKLCRAVQNRNTRVQHSSQKLCQGRFPHALLPVPGEKNANFPISRLFPRDHPWSLDLNVGSPRNAMAYAKFAFFSPRQHLPQTEGNIEIGVDGVSGGRPMQDARVCVFFARDGLQHHTLRFLLKRRVASSEARQHEGSTAAGAARAEQQRQRQQRHNLDAYLCLAV